MRSLSRPRARLGRERLRGLAVEELIADAAVEFVSYLASIRS
jgi:hypothetical protein